MDITSPQSSGQFIAILLLAGWSIPVLACLTIVIRKKTRWPMRMSMLLPAMTAVCAWLMLFCFVAAIFTGGETYKSGEPLEQFQLTAKGRIFEVSSESWRFQRWCDDHMAKFGRAALWTGLLSALVAGIYRGTNRSRLFPRREAADLPN